MDILMIHVKSDKKMARKNKLYLCSMWLWHQRRQQRTINDFYLLSTLYIHLN